MQSVSQIEMKKMLQLIVMVYPLERLWWRFSAGMISDA